MSEGNDHSTRYQHDEDVDEDLDVRELPISPREIELLHTVSHPDEHGRMERLLSSDERINLMSLASRMEKDIRDIASLDQFRAERDYQEIRDFQLLGTHAMTLAKTYHSYTIENTPLDEPIRHRDLQHENHLWNDVLTGLQDVSEKYRTREIDEAIGWLSTWQERKNQEELKSMFPPESTVIAGQPEVQDEVMRDMPFTTSNDYPKLSGQVTQEQVKDKNVIGNLPIHLEAQARSVTTYTPNMPYEVRNARSAAGRHYTPEEMREHTNHMLQYRVTEVQDNPADFRKDEVMVITQHPELVKALRERGLLGENSQVTEHLENPAQVYDKHLIGVVSADMKTLAQSVTSLAYNPETKEYGEPRTFQAKKLARIPVNDHKHRPIWFYDE